MKNEHVDLPSTLLVAATALALDLPLYTRNGEDFRGLEKLLRVVV